MGRICKCSHCRVSIRQSINFSMVLYLALVGLTLLAFCRSWCVWLSSLDICWCWGLLSAFSRYGCYWCNRCYGCNIFKPNPRVCRRVFPHRCPCGGPDILFEIVDDVNQFLIVKWTGVASKCFSIDLLLMSRLFVLQIKTFELLRGIKSLKSDFIAFFTAVSVMN